MFGVLAWGVVVQCIGAIGGAVGAIGMPVWYPHARYSTRLDFLTLQPEIGSIVAMVGDVEKRREEMGDLSSFSGHQFAVDIIY